MSKANFQVLESCLRPVGLEPSIIVDRLNEEPLQSYCENFLESRCGRSDEDVGLQFGLGFEPKLLGFIGYAAITSPTLGTCLRTLVEHLPVENSCCSLLLEEFDGCRLAALQIQGRSSRTAPQVSHFYAGLLCNAGRACLGSLWGPKEIWLCHSNRSDQLRHFERIFGAPVLLGKGVDAIVIPRAELDICTADADQYLSSFMHDAFVQNRRSLSPQKDFIVEVRNSIKVRIGHSGLTLDGVADEMGISRWVLRSRLKRSGIRFGGLVTQVRRELAHEYLSDQRVSLTEVALRLGYSELSAFSRAFRQWTGESPQQYQKRTSVFSER